jgi:hypothetical protein
MRITYSIAFAFNPDSHPVVNARVLPVLLETLIAVDRVYLRSSKEAGHAVPALYRSGVVYGRTRTWDSIPDVQAKKFGDCKSLVAWFCAEEREAGRTAKPVFRWIRNPNNGTRDFHILALTPKGFRDPSKTLGMNDHNQFIEPSR